MYVASVTNPSVYPLIQDPKRSDMDYIMGLHGRPGEGAGVQQGCPGFQYGPLGPRGLPLIKPPWGRITAIDLNTGEHVWTVPNGDTPDCVKHHPALKGLDLPKTGKPERAGIMVTRTLVFAGEGSGLFALPPYAGGPMFYAYDKKTVATVWEFKLPANQSGIPMTYMIDGRQYIVVAVGARGQPAELVALSLP
jgi:quinoprotein glucose dehydrogenase